MTKKSKTIRVNHLLRLGICVALIALIALVGAVMVSAEEPVYSEGLEFTSNGDGTCSVSGLGSCEEVEIVIPPVSPEGDKVTSIGYRAFYSCHSLVTVTIPEGVTQIGEASFYYCTKLSNITLPASLKDIGRGAFYECSKLTSIIIPEGVTSIGNWAFSTCNSLISISLPNSLSNIGTFAFFNCNSLTRIRIPKGIQVIKQYTFGHCPNLTSIVVSENVTTIEGMAFEMCGSLTSIALPSKLTSIEDGAFNFCEELSDIFYAGSKDEWNNIAIAESNDALYKAQIHYNVSLGDNGLAFKSNGDGTCSVSGIGTCTDTEIVIPSVSPMGDAVTSIDSFAFRDCNNLTSITIPESVTSIEYGANIFSYCANLSSIKVDDDNPVYHDDGNCVIHTASKELITGCKDSVIPADGSVISIGDFAFEGCTGLKDIEIPNTITSIGMCAFYDCDSLTEIELPDSITHVGYHTFVGCSNLETANIPPKVPYITWGMFAACRRLTTLTIPVDAALVGIAYESLVNTSITSLYLPQSIKFIDPSAFENCSNLTDIYYAGTEDEWKNIKTSLLEDASGVDLLGINIHYNCYGDLTGASLTLGDSLTMNYYAKADPTCGTPAMRFTYRGKIDTVRGIPTEKDGEYVFSLKGIAPQCMGETIKAELIVILEDGTELVVDAKESYSVRAYCDDALAANPDNKALATLLADLLAYGDASQSYTGFNADTPVSDGFPVAPSEWEDVTDTDFTLSDKTRDDIRFTAAGVRFGYVNRLYFKIKAADLTGVTVTVNGKTYTAEDLEPVENADTYILYTDAVYATEFDKVFVAELTVNGEVIQTVTYSVKSYVFAKQNGNDDMAALAKALYNYGRSALTYKNAQ